VGPSVCILGAARLARLARLDRLTRLAGWLHSPAVRLSLEVLPGIRPIDSF